MSPRAFAWNLANKLNIILIIKSIHFALRQFAFVIKNILYNSANGEIVKSAFVIHSEFSSFLSKTMKTL